MPTVSRIVPFLWFASQAEEAASYYVGIFKNSGIKRVTRYGSAGQEVTGGTPGSVMTVDFELDGQPFTALNGGPHFIFNEAVSFQVMCKDQAEIDYYWERLGAGGDPAAQQCGWLKDRFGLSWQVVPEDLEKLFADPNSEAGARAMNAMLGMKKMDIAALKAAYEGEEVGA
jgi:predicted 3-demethylubiquinone-9 3-methyltransferase (glyoxalase superfamily)